MERDWRKRVVMRVRVSRAEDLEDLKPVDFRICATAVLARVWENSEGGRVRVRGMEGFGRLGFDIWGFQFHGGDWIINHGGVLLKP